MHNQSGKNRSKSILNQVSEFYFNHFHNATQSIKRGFFISAIMIIIYNIQIISLLLSPSLVASVSSLTEQTTLQFFVDIFQASKLYPLFTEDRQHWSSTTALSFILVTLAIDLIFIFSLFSQMAIFIINQKHHHVHQKNQVQNIQGKADSGGRGREGEGFGILDVYLNHINNILQVISSLIFQGYLKILFIPFIQIAATIFFTGSQQSDSTVNLNSIDSQTTWSSGQSSLLNALAGIQFILTFIIGLLAAVHDYDFAYKLSDFLLKRDSIYTLIIFFIDFFLCILAGADLGSGLEIIHLLSAAFRLLDFMVQLTYYSKRIGKINVQLIIIQLLYSLLMLIYDFTVEKKNSDIVHAMILLFPVGLKFGQKLYEQRCEGIVQQPHQEIQSFIEVDIYIRMCMQYYDMDYKTYLTGLNGQIFEIICQNHYNTCQIEDDSCYCQEYSRDHVREISALDLRKKFLKHYITDVFQYHLQNSNDKKEGKMLFRLSYIAFLIEISQNPMQILSETVQLRQQGRKSRNRKQRGVGLGGGHMPINDNSFSSDNIENSHENSKNNYLNATNTNNVISLKEKLIVETMSRVAWETYTLYFQKNTQLVNQRLRIMGVIDFDERLTDLSQELVEALILQRDFYIILAGDKIDLELLAAAGATIRRRVSAIQANILQLFNLNPHNSLCCELTVIFNQLLNLRRQRLRNYLKCSTDELNSVMKALDLNLDFFHEDSCVIYISLLPPVGRIRRLTKSVATFFAGEDPDELMHNNLHTLMPQCIAQQHERFLTRFVSKCEMNLIAQGEFVTFGKSVQTGFVFPLTMRLRLDQFGENDFGASAFLLRPKLGVEYVLFDDKFMLLEITELLYRKLLRVHFGQEPGRSKTVDVRRLCLLLWSYDIKNTWPASDKEKITSCLIIPQEHTHLAFLQQHHGNPLQQMLKQFQHINFRTYAFIEVQFSLSHYTTMSTKEKLYNLFAVHSMKRLTQVKDKVEALNNLKTIVNKTLGLDIKLTSVQTSGSDNQTHKFTSKASYYYQSGVTFCRTIESGQMEKRSLMNLSIYDDDFNFSAKTGKVSSSEINRLMSSHSLKKQPSHFKKQHLQSQASQLSKETPPHQQNNSSKGIGGGAGSIDQLAKQQSQNQFQPSNSELSNGLGTQHPQSALVNSELESQEKKVNPVNLIPCQSDVLHAQASKYKEQEFYEYGPFSVNKVSLIDNFPQLMQIPNAATTPGEVATEEEQGGTRTMPSKVQSVLDPQLLQQPSVKQFQSQQYQNSSEGFQQHSPNNEIEESSIFLKQQQQQQQASQQDRQQSQFGQGSEVQKSAQQFLPEIRIVQRKSQDIVMELPEALITQLKYYKVWHKAFNKLRGSMWWLQKCKQQAFFQDEDELKQANKQQYKVDNEIVMDEEDEDLIKRKRQGSIDLVKPSDDNQPRQEDGAGVKQANQQDYDQQDSKMLFKQQTIKRKQEEVKLRQKKKDSIDLEHELNENEKKMMLAERADASSQHSSQGDYVTQKKAIINNIYDETPPLLIRSINLLGYFSFIALLIVSSYTYGVVIKSYDNAVLFYGDMIQGPGLLQDHSLIIKYNEFDRLIQKAEQILDKKASDARLQEAQQRQPQLLQDYKITLNSYLSSRSDRQAVVYARDSLAKITYFFDQRKPAPQAQEGRTQRRVLSGHVDSANKQSITQCTSQLNCSSKPNRSLKTTIIQEQNGLLQSLTEFLQFAYAYINQDGKDYRLFMMVNLEEYLKQYDEIVSFGSEDGLDNLELTKTTIIYTTVLIEVVALASIMMIIPIYSRIQKEREDILVLFGSFARDKLEPQINKYEDSAFKVQEISGLAPSQMQHLQKAKNIQYKRRVQSSTSNVPKYSLFLLFGAMMSFCFISIAPAINCGLTYFTIDDFRHNLDEIHLISSYKSDLAVLFAVNFAKISSMLQFNVGIVEDEDDIFLQAMQSNALDRLLNSTQEKVEKRLSELYTIQNNFLDDDQGNSIRKKNLPLYRAFFQAALNEDICQTLFRQQQIWQDYKKSLRITFTEQQCTAVYAGLMKKGMLVIMKQSGQIFQDFKVLYEQQLQSLSQNSDKSQGANSINYLKLCDRLKQFDQENQLVELDQMADYVMQVSDILIFFLLDQAQLFFDDLSRTQLILYMVILISVIAVFLIAWVKFIYYIHKSLLDTKKLVSLFMMDVIFDNPYIMSYLKKIAKK